MTSAVRSRSATTPRSTEAASGLRSPEQLDELMKVTDLKGWISLVVCTLVLAGCVVWGLLGHVETRVAASGVFTPSGGLVELTAGGEGELTSIEVAPGELVHKGQVVANIAQPALAQQIETSRRRLDELMVDADAGALSVSEQSRLDRRKSDVEQLEKLLVENGQIESTVDGRVLEILAASGEHVSGGRPLAVIERIADSRGEGLEALLYFDSNVGKALRPGMAVEVAPIGTRKVSIIGRIKSVEPYPSTRLGMMGAIRNEQLVDSFIQNAGGAPIAVRVELQKDKTYSGYQWTNGVGPDVRLTTGTRCFGSVITTTHRPIALVFPALDR